MKSIPQLLDEYGWETMRNGNRRKEIDGWIYDWENAAGPISSLCRWPVAPHNSYDLEQFVISTEDKAAEILGALTGGEHLSRIDVNPETPQRSPIVK